MFIRILVGLSFFLTLNLEAAEPVKTPITEHVRPSLKEMGATLKKSDEITQLFRASLKEGKPLTPAQLKEIEKPNLALMYDFQNLASESTSFVRGEIEDETVLSHLLGLLQLSMLRMRTWETETPSKKYLAKIKDECTFWFQFAADLPYNEASLVGLRTSGVIRSFLIDELEELEQKQGPALSQNELWLNWLLQLRTPWPVDRMLLTEAKRSLHPQSMGLAEKVAAKIQKNPYLSVETALKQIPGGKPAEVDVLKKLWRDEDMAGMKTEMNRLQTLRLKLAAAVFEKRQHHGPAKVQDLVEAHLLTSAPIDYFSGLPMQLPQAGKVESGTKNP